MNSESSRQSLAAVARLTQSDWRNIAITIKMPPRRFVVIAGIERNRAGRIIEAAMTLSRITFGKIALAWGLFLWCAAMILPNLDSHTRVNPVVNAIILLVYALYLIGTPIALVIYFNSAWRRVPTVPNKTAYVIWISLETFAGACLLGLLAYATASFALTRFR